MDLDGLLALTLQPVHCFYKLLQYLHSEKDKQREFVITDNRSVLESVNIPKLHKAMNMRIHPVMKEQKVSYL